MVARRATKVNNCWHTLVGMRRSSAETKAVILAAARERFATTGYQAATIRAIAADAHIDPSMVMRYFGNKDQLFAAAAEFDLRLPDLSDVPKAELGAALVAHFLDRWSQDDGLIVLLRSATTNAEAAGRMQGIFADQLRPAIARLNPSDPARCAGLIATQVLGLAMCRFVLKLPPIVAMTDDDLVHWLAPTLQRYLDEA